MAIGNLGIIGAGVMGAGIAADAAARGIRVVLHDQSEQVLETVDARIKENLGLLRFAKAEYRGLDEPAVMGLIHKTTDLTQLRDAELIVENITEDIALKEKLYAQLHQVCKEETVLAVNTSCVSITRLAALVPPASRVVGVHFMNPVPMKRVAEVIRGYHTSEDTLDAVKGLLSSLDKEAVVVNDSPGFVSNRVSHVMMNECAYLVMEGVATPQDIDKLFRLAFGHAMGPLATADLIGVDTVLRSIEVLHESYRDSKYRPCPLLRKMVDAGLTGRKSGQGFFAYGKREAKK